MTQILIKGGHVAAGDGGTELPETDVLIDDGVITSVAPGVNGAPGATVIDAAGMIVMPGLVDSHRHVWQAPLRGVGADMTLPDYLATVLGPILTGYTPQDAGLATLLGAAEALDAGITTVFDWSNTTTTEAHTDAVRDAFAAAGIRAVVGLVHPDHEAYARRVQRGPATVTAGFAIAGMEYGDHDDTVRSVRLARDMGVTVTMHAGGPAVRALYDVGLLGPHVNLVHLNGMTADDAKMLAETGAGVTVTPVVEGTMGHGASAYGRLWDAGARAGLGTDVVVNAPVDLFEPMRDTLRTERLRTATMLPAGAILPAATVDSARAIGLDHIIGTVEVGKRADLILLDGLPAPSAAAAVANGSRADVHTVIVEGRIVKRDGRLVDLDLAALRRASRALAQRVLR
ncbi:amidohydrolase family protein [Allorhizocola rhizosphaerae]|uniref:amidohydrolase family protein n=1 Tax=Allorhizocola rhizosphaerae TaxID=1872709 RepID=UPI000E3BFBAA|nr:amidohydrolase family protein [Allorhizocola rhizosphaerae]